MTAAQEAFFQPADGVQSRKKYAYDIAISREPGDAITYEELAEALNWQYHPGDGQMRGLLCQAMDAARAQLESEGRNTVATKEKFGWIVLDAAGALRQVKRRLDKTRNQLVRTARGLGAAHREQLSQADRQERDLIASNLPRAAALMGGRKRHVFTALEQESKRRKEIEGR